MSVLLAAKDALSLVNYLAISRQPIRHVREAAFTVRQQSLLIPPS